MIVPLAVFALLDAGCREVWVTDHAAIGIEPDDSDDDRRTHEGAAQAAAPLRLPRPAPGPQSAPDEREGAMRVTLREGHAGTFLLVAEDGRDILIQSDWDFPGARLDLRLVPVPLRRNGRDRRLRAPQPKRDDARSSRTSSRRHGRPRRPAADIPSASTPAHLGRQKRPVAKVRRGLRAHLGGIHQELSSRRTRPRARSLSDSASGLFPGGVRVFRTGDTSGRSAVTVSDTVPATNRDATNA